MEKDYQPTLAQLRADVAKITGAAAVVALANILKRVTEIDDGLNTASLPPIGDDYNRLFDAIVADEIPAAVVASRGVHPRQTPAMLKMVCGTCGSGDVRQDAYAAWSVERQEWELSSTYDNSVCEKCGGETRLDEQALIGCQHGEHEDCMTCVECGECREDLDDDDRCGDCRGDKDDDEPVDGRPMVAGDIYPEPETIIVRGLAHDTTAPGAGWTPGADGIDSKLGS